MNTTDKKLLIATSITMIGLSLYVHTTKSDITFLGLDKANTKKLTFAVTALTLIVLTSNHTAVKSALAK